MHRSNYEMGIFDYIIAGVFILLFMIFFVLVISAALSVFDSPINTEEAVHLCYEESMRFERKFTGIHYTSIYCYKEVDNIKTTCEFKITLANDTDIDYDLVGCNEEFIRRDIRRDD